MTTAMFVKIFSPTSLEVLFCNLVEQDKFIVNLFLTSIYNLLSRVSID